MPDSPRIRRLRSDLRAMERLQAESSVIDFTSVGSPPDRYIVRFFGKGFWRPQGGQEVLIRERHEVVITLGASYPRMMPELQWRTPIFQPNISASGVVCLGGYGTHWVPSLSLDELCGMLWDMVRYENFDVESPYNREAALWAKSQRAFLLPIDPRPIRNRIQEGTAPSQPAESEIKSPALPTAAPTNAPPTNAPPTSTTDSKPPVVTAPPIAGDDELIFIDDTSVADDDADADVVDAEIVEGEDPDILFID